MATDEVCLLTDFLHPEFLLTQTCRHSQVQSRKVFRPVQHLSHTKDQGKDKALSLASLTSRMRERLQSTQMKSSKMSATMKTFTWQMVAKTETLKLALPPRQGGNLRVKAETMKSSLFSDVLILIDQTLKNMRTAAALAKSSTLRVRISPWSLPDSAPAALATYSTWPYVA